MAEIIVLDERSSLTGAALNRSDSLIENIDQDEVNEAFARDPLAWRRVIGAHLAEPNINGEVSRLGNLSNAIGIRLLLTLVQALQAHANVTACRSYAKVAVSTMSL